MTYRTRTRRAHAARISPPTLRNAINVTLDALERRVLLSTYVVNTTGDLPAVDASISELDANGDVSLRSAIERANYTVDDDVIHFGIDGTGVHTIAPATQLPTIINQVSIDGYTQPGASPNTLTVGKNAVLMIEVDGSNAGDSSGFVATAIGSVFRGLVINRFQRAGIELEDADSSRIEGSYIGTDTTGAFALPNEEDGIRLLNAAGVRIGTSAIDAGNVISGNLGDGVHLVDGGADIQGNHIGIDATGTVALGNAKGIFSTGSLTRIGSATVGGGNVISGNVAEGVVVEAGTGFPQTDNSIRGNFIGTNATGTAEVGNGDSGVVIRDIPNFIVGGTSTGSRNIISGNTGYGVYVAGTLATGAVIAGNYIGTDVTGSFAVRNRSVGVAIESASPVVGGTIAAARNVISGNDEGGVFVFDHAVVQGNFIGTDATGMFDVGNGFTGVAVAGSDSTIGGATAATGNVIAFNHGIGVHVFFQPLTADYDHATIRRNSIHSNTGLGIGLSQDGVTPNDLGDADTGPNNLQNFPVLASVASSGGATTVQGALNSKSNQIYLIDFYANDDLDASGMGEGRSYLGTTTVTTDSFGNATFTANLRAGALVGQFVSATATSTATAPHGDTSEFSEAIEVGAPTLAPAPLPTLSISDVTVTEGNSGSTSATFTVLRSGSTAAASTVLWTTSDGSAIAPGDYTAITTPMLLTFAAGELSKTIVVQVEGDVLTEQNEQFDVTLSGVTGATIADGQGTGTIVDDEPRLVASGRTNLKADKKRQFAGVVASFTSADFSAANKFSATINWGDGKTSAGQIVWNSSTSRWDVVGSHTYAKKGKFNLLILITDANGATGTANSLMTV